MTKTKHVIGEFESKKFDYRIESFYKYLTFLEEKNIVVTDLLEHFPAYVGHMALNRVFTLYEYYKMATGVAGHIAELGVYKGSGSLLFAKLVQIHESESLTQVHGFDWFQGTGESSNKDSDLVPEGGYQCSYDDLMKLIELQKLDHIVRIHDFDVTVELKKFFEKNLHLHFKLIFMDCGMYEVMKVALPEFWDRLVPGGIMIFDQFNHEFAPGETLAIKEFLPGVKIKTLPNSWMPNAYAIKE
tara:strand:+ start:186 stop:914 length:729 start_codon:yes stop_codon:yes gene_type:complete